jgi:hypothetical protein
MFLGYNYRIMLKSLALIVLLAVTGIRDTGKKNDGSNLAENNGDNKASPTSTVINNQACPPDKDGTSAQSPSWYVSPEWWLCILGVPTLLFIGWQAKATANAAKSVEKQTKELAIQNRNMVARERARISLHSVSKPQILDDLTFANIIKITIYVVNAGSSTAFNVKALGTMNIVKIDDKEEETVNAAIDPEDWYDLEIPKIISPTEDGNPISITIDRVGGLIKVDLVIIGTRARSHYCKDLLLISREDGDHRRAV